MPKVVDHEERRRGLAKALWQVAKARGMEAVSLREVAAEAGVSMGTVQHYFKTKDDMLLYALEFMNEENGKRVRERVLASADPQSPYEILHACLVEMLPMDEDSRTGLLIGIAYFVRALADPALGEVARRGWPNLRRFFTDMILQAQKAGDVPADLHAAHEADILLGLAEGLASQSLMGHHTPQEALTIATYRLDQLFTRVS